VSHARWILAVTLVAVAAAAALTLTQTPTYTSQALVVVEPAAAAADNGVGPNMATEESVVASWVVLSKAASALDVSVTTLQQGLSVSVPGTTSILQIAYSDRTPGGAQERARAIAQAYVAYRGPASATGSASSTAPTATLVTPASLPASPGSPDYAIDLGAALIVGLALGIGSAALRDYLDDRVRGPLDVEAQTGAPVLAVIPAFRLGRGDRGGRLVMETHPDSVAAEAYRGLRTRVVQAAAARGVKTLLVTSPGWEDRSTVAANLSAALAQRGGRVLLQSDDQPEQLQDPQWRAAQSARAGEADFVVIEAPSMLAPQFGLYTEVADMIIIVADARRSTRTQLRLALREVEPVRDKLAGCVLDNAGRARHLGPRSTADAGTGNAPGGAAGPRPAVR